jgi:hypothetical protein
MDIAKEILINGCILPFRKNFKSTQQFEFIINQDLKLLQCVQLFTANSRNNQRIITIENNREVHNILFELNHVRVNPKLNNYLIITNLIKILTELGIRMDNPPNSNSIAICFQPLGDIKDNVRFYIKENNKMVFLTDQIH